MIRPPDTRYRGVRLVDAGVITVRVSVEGQPLVLPHTLRCASGYEWGYGGAGPAMLALALVRDATGDTEVSFRCYTWFKWAVVACWGQSWEITAHEIREWVNQWEAETLMKERAAVAIIPGWLDDPRYGADVIPIAKWGAA